MTTAASHIASESTLSSTAAVGAVAFYVTALLALLTLLIAAIRSIVRSDQLTGAGRLVWIAGVIAFPFVGSLVWFAIGRNGVPHLYRSQLA